MLLTETTLFFLLSIPLAKLWAPKIFKTQRIQTQKINTNQEISSTNLENQTQEHKKVKPRTHEHKPN